MNFFFCCFCFNDVKQRVLKDIYFGKLTPKFIKQKSNRQLHTILCRSTYVFSKHFTLLMIWWRNPNKSVLFQIDLLSNLNIFRLVLGDWSCSENIKQGFLMIQRKSCFTKSVVNKWAYISETHPNQPDYPWCSKY